MEREGPPIPESLRLKPIPLQEVAPAPGRCALGPGPSISPRSKPPFPGARNLRAALDGRWTQFEWARPAPPISLALVIAVWRTTTIRLHFR